MSHTSLVQVFCLLGLQVFLTAECQLGHWPGNNVGHGVEHASSAGIEYSVVCPQPQMGSIPETFDRRLCMAAYLNPSLPHSAMHVISL